MSRRRRKRRSRKIKIGRLHMDWKIVAAVGMFIAIFYFLISYSTNLGFDTDIGTDFIVVFPGLFVSIVGFLVVARISGLYSLPGMAAVGIGIAFLMEALYDLGYITTQMMTGLTIGEIQMWVIIIACFCGAIIASVTSGKRF